MNDPARAATVSHGRSWCALAARAGDRFPIRRRSHARGADSSHGQASDDVCALLGAEQVLQHIPKSKDSMQGLVAVSSARPFALGPGLQTLTRAWAGVTPPRRGFVA